MLLYQRLPYDKVRIRFSFYTEVHPIQVSRDTHGRSLLMRCEIWTQEEVDGREDYEDKED